MEIIQVSATSPTSAVARAISSVVHEYHCAEVQAIGAEAVDQAMQALTLATGYLEHDGICVNCVTQYVDAIMKNQHVTLIKLIVTATSTPSMSPVPSSDLSIKAKDLPRV